MRTGGWKDFATRYNNITLISGDAMPDQLYFLNTGMVDGLVGQLPYDMGRIAIEVLFGMAVQGTVYQQKVITTNILEHVRIPINLPPLVVNQNLIGNLRIVAYVLFGILASTALGFAAWMYQNRKVRVVKVAQPMFLIMVAAGVFLMGTTMIPLSFDLAAKSWSAAIKFLAQVSHRKPASIRPFHEPFTPAYCARCFGKRSF